jgi:hypothetical protein
MSLYACLHKPVNKSSLKTTGSHVSRFYFERPVTSVGAKKKPPRTGRLFSHHAHPSSRSRERNDRLQPMLEDMDCVTGCIMCTFMLCITQVEPTTTMARISSENTPIDRLSR